MRMASVCEWQIPKLWWTETSTAARFPLRVGPVLFQYRSDVVFGVCAGRSPTTVYRTEPTRWQKTYARVASCWEVLFTLDPKMCWQTLYGVGGSACDIGDQDSASHADRNRLVEGVCICLVRWATQCSNCYNARCPIVVNLASIAALPNGETVMRWKRITACTSSQEVVTWCSICEFPRIDVPTMLELDNVSRNTCGSGQIMLMKDKI